MYTVLHYDRLFAGTLTQNDMQVVRMWIGGSNFRDLDQLQPLEPGTLPTPPTHLAPCVMKNPLALQGEGTSWPAVLAV